MGFTRALASLLLVAFVAVGTTAEEAPVKVAVAAHSHLNDATGLINKNTVMHSQNVAITRSNMVAQQDDILMMDEQEGDDEAGGAIPSDLTLTGERDMLTSPDVTEGDENHFRGGASYSYSYRYRYFVPSFRGGYYGWRYPAPYWRRYGYRRYGGYCPYGRYMGGYYYC